jgi:antitoxin MazE
MAATHLALRKIGNSHGFVIPKPVLDQLGLSSKAEMSIEDGALVLRKPAPAVRDGWAQAARAVAEHADDALVMGEFANEGDADLSW